MGLDASEKSFSVPPAEWTWDCINIAHSQDLASLEITGPEDCLHVEVGKGRLFEAKVLARLLNFYK